MLWILSNTYAYIPDHLMWNNEYSNLVGRVGGACSTSQANGMCALEVRYFASVHSEVIGPFLSHIPDRFGFALTYVRFCEVGGTTHNNDGVVGASMFAVWNSASTDSWGIVASLYIADGFWYYNDESVYLLSGGYNATSLFNGAGVHTMELDYNASTYAWAIEILLFYIADQLWFGNSDIRYIVVGSRTGDGVKAGHCTFGIAMTSHAIGWEIGVLHTRYHELGKCYSHNIPSCFWIHSRRFVEWIT